MLPTDSPPGRTQTTVRPNLSAAARTDHWNQSDGKLPSLPLSITWTSTDACSLTWQTSADLRCPSGTVLTTWARLLQRDRTSSQSYIVITNMVLSSALCLKCNWQVFCGGGVELSRRFDAGHISKLWPLLPRRWLRGFIKVFTESPALWGPAGTTQPGVQELQHRNTNFTTFMHSDGIPTQKQNQTKVLLSSKLAKFTFLNMYDLFSLLVEPWMKCDFSVETLDAQPKPWCWLEHTPFCPFINFDFSAIFLFLWPNTFNLIEYNQFNRSAHKGSSSAQWHSPN